jgi:two-component system, chemotaxis family, CheB/CheR fusion protein
MESAADQAFEALLLYMRDSRGFDFTGYKRTSLMRRVRHRMDQAGYTAFEEYLDVLQASSDEFAALFNTILINVTAFFRDQQAWDFIGAEIIPRMLAEAMCPDAFRQRVKIYATDIDEEALAEARIASYARQGRRGGASTVVGALLRTGR